MPRVKFKNAHGMRHNDENIHTTFAITGLRSYSSMKQAVRDFFFFLKYEMTTLCKDKSDILHSMLEHLLGLEIQRNK